MTEKQKIIADTHVHVYPCYRLDVALETLLLNLNRISPSAIKMAFLTERNDCSFFSDPICIFKFFPISNCFLVFETVFEKKVLTITKNDDSLLYLFPGRQIVTAERVEILCLMTDARIDDGLPLKIVADQILEAGGLPVVSWAPGKWFFKRGKTVDSFIQQMQPNQLLIGDTSLRPKLWRTPSLIKKAEKAGFKILAGSDPLPFPGEEKKLGIYCSIFEGAFDKKNPQKSLKSLFADPDVQFNRAGRRDGLYEVFLRIQKNARNKKRFD